MGTKLGKMMYFCIIIGLVANLSELIHNPKLDRNSIPFNCLLPYPQLFSSTPLLRRVRFSKGVFCAK